jgi:hypothetical protein
MIPTVIVGCTRSAMTELLSTSHLQVNNAAELWSQLFCGAQLLLGDFYWRWYLVRFVAMHS